jgi:hypothetical protein
MTLLRSCQVTSEHGEDTNLRCLNVPPTTRHTVTTDDVPVATLASPGSVAQ